MDGENNGKPYEQMDDLGGPPLLLETPKCLWNTFWGMSHGHCVLKDSFGCRMNTMENWQNDKPLKAQPTNSYSENWSDWSKGSHWPVQPENIKVQSCIKYHTPENVLCYPIFVQLNNDPNMNSSNLQSLHVESHLWKSEREYAKFEMSMFDLSKFTQG